MSIPRVFHQVWINDQEPELPEQYRNYRDSWLARHPNWEYHLWNLDNLPFRSRNAEVLARNEGTLSQLADALRYELLYEFGGVFLDTDFECLRPIDGILEGVRNFTCSANGRTLAVGILGSERSSSLMSSCVENFPRRLGLENAAIETGPGFFTQVLLRQGFHNNLTVFPTKWFYPYDWDEPHLAQEAFPEAYAVHRWAQTWAVQDRSLRLRLRRRLHRVFGNG